MRRNPTKMSDEQYLKNVEKLFPNDPEMVDLIRQRIERAKEHRVKNDQS